MDGFVLPSFESTCIIKDKDIIRFASNCSIPFDGFSLCENEKSYVVYFEFCVSVRRKGGPLIDLLKVGAETSCSEDEAILEKQHISGGVKLLAIEEFNKEAGGYESESEEDEPDQPEETKQVETASAANAGSKKRKASRKIKSQKYVLKSLS